MEEDSDLTFEEKVEKAKKEVEVKKANMVCPKCESEEVMDRKYKGHEWTECYDCGWMNTDFETLPPEVRQDYLNAWDYDPIWDGIRV